MRIETQNNRAASYKSVDLPFTDLRPFEKARRCGVRVPQLLHSQPQAPWRTCSVLGRSRFRRRLIVLYFVGFRRQRAGAPLVCVLFETRVWSPLDNRGAASHALTTIMHRPDE